MGRGRSRQARESSGDVSDDDVPLCRFAPAAAKGCFPLRAGLSLCAPTRTPGGPGCMGRRLQKCTWGMEPGRAWAGAGVMRARTGSSPPVRLIPEPRT